MKTIGIDPGMTGALALVCDGIPTEWMAMPRHGAQGAIDWNEVLTWLDWHREGVNLVAIEKVAAMPKQGVKGVFTFGMAYGGLLALLEGTSIPFELVHPQRWKKAVLRDVDRSKKSASVEYLRRRFPDHDFRRTKRARVPHDGITDAVCLALYAHKELTR